MSNEKTVVIVGVGYVGLPIAILAREKGWNVYGLDITPERVDAINRQQSPVGDDLTPALQKYPIKATLDPKVATEADVIIIAVPTPVTHTNLPDLGPLKDALTNIRPYLKPGQVLVVESTINPGVMDEVVVPVLQERSDLVLDSTGQTENAVYLAHCPERINPGDAKWTVRNIPRVIGGYTEEGVTKAKAFYDSVLEAPVKMMSSVTEAEAVKIMENTFRDVNIAFINEMAKSFAVLGIDITHVIEGAATKPFAFMPHYPGNGVGGHCISVDPYYMIERARQAGFDHEFLKLAREINDSMPAYTVDLMTKAMSKLSLDKKDVKIAMLGLAYKKDIGDMRESPALTVRDLLEAQGFTVQIFDPYVPQQSNVPDLEAAMKDAQIVMLTTNHSQFVEALTPDFLQSHSVKLVIDGKNALDADGIAAKGIPYYGVGRARAAK